MASADPRLPRRSAARAGHKRTSPVWRGIVLGLAAAGLGYGAYALAKKREALPWLVRWRVQPREWVGHAPLRIAAVSVRCAARTPAELRHFAALLRRIERLGADVVVILDLDLGHDRGPEDEAHAEAAVAALARLHGPKGRFFLPDAAGAELMADAGFVPLSRHGRPLPDMASGAVSETAPAPDAAPAAAGGFAVAFLHAADHHRPEGAQPAVPLVAFTRDPQVFAQTARLGHQVPLVVAASGPRGALSANGQGALTALCDLAAPSRYDETGRTLIRAATLRLLDGEPRPRGSRAEVTLIDISDPGGW